MDHAQTRQKPIASAPNLRDLGGLPAENGVTKPGVVFRSATLGMLADVDVPQFSALGIRTVYDLRTAAEAQSSPDRLPEGTRLVTLDVLADSSLSIAASLGELSTNPRAFVAALGGGKAEAMFEDTYRDLVRLPSALHSYRSFYLDLTDQTREGAALFHCTTGKDRTGWAAASLLLLLGVDESDVYADYLQTNTDLLPALEPLLRQVEKQGVDRELLMPVVGVRESYLAAALDQMRSQFGTIEDYATKGLRLSSAELGRLRALFA